MFSELLNGFYFGIFLPTKNGMNIFFSSNIFYYSNFILIFLSLFIIVIRNYQIIKKKNSFVELFVFLLRLIQIALIIFIGNELPLNKVFSIQLWEPIFQPLFDIQFHLILWDFVGFGIIFAIYNFIIYIFTKSVTIIITKIFKIHGQISTIHTAIIVSLKNVFVIPVSIIYILILLQVI